MAILLRRRLLGKTSCNAISRFSREGITPILSGRDLIPTAPGYLFRWGCTTNIPLSIGPYAVVNDAASIHLVNDKVGFREAIGELAPPTFRLDAHVQGLTYPAILRPAVHHQGRHFHVVNSYQQLQDTIARNRRLVSGYASPLINKEAEYRVYVVQGRAVCVARKIPADATQVAWNVFQGARFENVPWNEWPLKAVKTSIKAFLISGLDFGGVDVIVDREGACFVLEINSAPSLTSEYRQRCFAKAFDYILANGKAVIPLQEAPGGYRKFIHPAVLNNETT